MMSQQLRVMSQKCAIVSHHAEGDESTVCCSSVASMMSPQPSMMSQWLEVMSEHLACMSQQLAVMSQGWW